MSGISGAENSNSVNLGRKGKFGQIKLENFKGGIKLSDLKNAKQIELFKKFDADKNDVLDADEMQKLQQSLGGYAEDGKITKREAKKYIKGQDLKGEVDKKELFEFLNLIDKSSGNIEKAEVVLEDAQKTIAITYNDGRTETINPDKTSQIAQTDENGTTTTRFLDESKKLLKEEVVDKDGNKTVTGYEDDGKTPKSEVMTTKDGKTMTVNYENGKPVSKEVTCGNTTENYEYVNNKERITSNVENKDNDALEKRTAYTYDDEAGTVTEVLTESSNSSTGTKITTTVKKDGSVLQETIVDGDTKTLREPQEGGTIKETVADSTANTKAVNILNSEKHRLTQTKTVNGTEYTLNYDGEGNTKIIVQNGESISAIAGKFGCTEQQLKELNAEVLNGKKYFDVGAEIRVPGELEADTQSLQGRKSADAAKAEYARDAQIRAERRARDRAEMQSLGIVNRKGAGTVVNTETQPTKDGQFKNFNQNSDKYKNMTYTLVGQTGNRGRMVVKGSDGNYYTMAYDGTILKKGYAAATRAYDLDRTASRADGHNRRTVTVGNQEYVFSHDGKLLKTGYVEASDVRDKGGAKNTLSNNDVKYVVDSNGQTWYFNNDAAGQALSGQARANVVKQEVNAVSDQLYNAAKGLGTDEDLLTEGVNNIYSREILQGVNAELKTKDSAYTGDTQTMPVEALILDEMSHTAARPLLKTLIDSGTMTTEEKAHTIKREIEYEVHGGLGYTSTSDLNEAMQLCSERNVRLEVENQFKNDHPELSENEGSVVRSYIAGDGWNAQEVDQFDANWVKTGAYQEARYVYQTDENGNVVSDKNGQPVIVLDEGDQAHREGVIGRLVFDYQDKEALNKGLDAVNSDPNSFDYQYLEQRAGKEIAGDPQGKYQARFTNQDNVQRYLAGFHSDERGNVDAGNVSASNTCLYKGVKPAEVQAQELLYDVKNGDYSQTFDSMDAETYSAMSEYIANGDVEGVKNMTELYNKAYSSANNSGDKTKIKANAILSGQVDFTDDQITDFCVELMHSIDKNKGLGGSTGMSAGYTNSADYQTEQLKAILSNNPQVMSTVQARVEKDNFSYTTTIQSGGGPGQKPVTSTFTTDTKDSYLQILADTKNIVQDEVFYDEKGNKITDREQIDAIKSANMQSLERMRQYVAELEREYKKGVDAEGLLSDGANYLSTYSGLGTDREDVATEYRNAKLMLQQFEAAAQGKLRDSQGNVISAQDLAQQMLDKQSSLAETNSDYKQTIAYGKMGIALAPVIVATTVASGGAAAAGLGTLGVAAAGGAAAGTATYGVNALEYNTSYTGKTAEAREQNMKDSAVAAATTAIGIGQMKYISGMANNMGTAARTGIRLGTTVAADTGVGATAEYAATGNISVQGTATNMIMSGVGNVIGAKSLGKKVENTVTGTTGGTGKSQRVRVSRGVKGDVNNHRDVIADGEIARNIDQQHLNANERKMVEEGLDGVPTAEELAAYQKEMAYQPVPEADQPAYQAHQEQVAADYADAHRLENNAVVKEQKPAPTVSKDAIDKLQDEIKGLDGSISNLEKRIAGAKRFGKNTEALEKQLANLQGKRATKAAELDAIKVKADTPVTPAKETPAAEVKAEIIPESVNQSVNDIPDAKIPVEQKGLWQNCKNKINEITDELKNFKGDVNAMLAKCNALFADLKTIANNVEDSVKKQIEKIMTDIKAMLDSKGIIRNGADAPQISSSDRIAMGQISNNINSAKTLKALEDAQKWLDQIPDCSQKAHLQKQLDAKRNSIVIEPEVVAVADFTNAKRGTKLPKNEPVILSGNETLRLAGYDLDLSASGIQAKLKAMKDGEIITVGRGANGPNDIRLSDAPDTVSRQHLTIKKSGNEYIVTDLSKNGTTIGNKKSAAALHKSWVQARKDLFGDNMHDYGFWSGYTPKDQTHGAWKMHLYSVSEEDWRQMCDVIIPYLKKHDVDWKTFNAVHTPEMLDGEQAGKAFTVYPKNNQDMAQIAKDLDALIRQHKLETSGSHIVGDREMGDSGRLFYRYELNSGQYKDQILDLADKSDYDLYRQLYDSNRGEGNYLASDMTPADDIWLNFDPSDPYSQVSY